MNALVDFLSTPLGKTTLKVTGAVLGFLVCWAMGYKAVLIILACLYLCLRFFVLFATFPGSGYLSRKSFERSWETGEAQQLYYFCQALLDIIACAQEQRTDRDLAVKIMKRLRWFDEVRLLCIHFQELRCTKQLDPTVIKVREQIRALWTTLENIVIASATQNGPGGEIPQEYTDELKLIGLMEYYSKLHQGQPILIKKYRFKNFRDYEYVATQTGLLMKEVDALTDDKKGMISAQKTKFFKPRVMGSLEELRIQQSNRRPLVRMEIPISHFCKLDSVLMLPKIDQETEIRQMERIKSVEQYIYDTKILSKNLPSTSEQYLADAASAKSCITTNKLVFVYCNPNAGIYEIADLGESELINTITGEYQGFVFLWNYRGYGASSGSPSMQGLADDGKQVVKFLRHGLGFSKVIFWGRSMGGHVCKAVSTHADGIIIDRSFNIISSVPRNMFKKTWVQQAYEIILGSHKAGIEELCRSNTPTILLSSLNNDEVIPTFGSVHTAITAELTDTAFNSKPQSVKYYQQIKNMPGWLAATPLWKRFLNSAMHTSYSEWIESHITRVSEMIIPRDKTAEVHSILSSLAIQTYHTVIERQKQKEEEERKRRSSSPLDNMPQIQRKVDQQETSEEDEAPTNDHSSVELTNNRDQSLMQDDNAVKETTKSDPDIVGRRDYLKALTHIAENDQGLDKLMQLVIVLQQSTSSSCSLMTIYANNPSDEDDEMGTAHPLHLWVVDAIVWGFSSNHNEFMLPGLNIDYSYSTRVKLMANMFQRASEQIRDTFAAFQNSFEQGCDSETAEAGVSLVSDLEKLCDYLAALSSRAGIASEYFTGKAAADIPETRGNDNLSSFKKLLQKLSESKFLELRSNFAEFDLAASHNKEIPSQAVKHAIKQMVRSVKYSPPQITIPLVELTSILDTSSL